VHAAPQQPPCTLNLELNPQRTYFRSMKRIAFLLLGLAGVVSLPIHSTAQDAAAAAAVAAKQEADERYQRINTTLESLIAAQEAQKKTIAKLREELNQVRDDSARGGSKYATQEDLKRLTDKIAELDKRRIEDIEHILAEIDKIAKAVGPAPPPADNRSKGKKGAPPKGADSGTPASPGGLEKGFYYTVKEGEFLNPIIAAYNEKFKEEGKKSITLKQVLDANPGLKPEKMRVGQKIFIPLPPE